VTRASRTPWPRRLYISELSLRSRSDIPPKIVLTAPQIGQPKSNSLHFLQIKFHKLNGSHIAKSTKNHSLPHLRHFPASRPGSTIADWRNPASLAPPALVPASAPVSYLSSPDLNLASEGPERTTPGCSQTTVRFPGMHLDSAGSAPNPRCDC